MKGYRVDSDTHGLMAVSMMLTYIDDIPLDSEGYKPLPDAAQWLAMWNKALAATRTQAEMMAMADTGHLMPQFPSVQTNPPPQEESVPKSEPVKPDGSPYAAPDATSDNLVSLMECSEPGCTNMIPTTKSLALCHLHEPKLEGDEPEVEDA